MVSGRRSQGAELVESGGVRYRTWAPEHRAVEALVLDANGAIRRAIPLAKEAAGYFAGLDELGAAGDLYKYRLDGGDAWPDPASRAQPQSVHGPSLVVDPDVFRWSDSAWSPPPLSELIIYELHVGTFTPAGTFRSAIERLDALVELGVNAIEIMPVADFPGARNWGYDGVMLYAPAHCYGSPDDMRALIDAAHARQLAVILDVVYNHLGPDGNYLGCYSASYLSHAHKTPWGDGFNFESPPVRNFFLENPSYWMREFHIDGFRLDATHAIADNSETHLLAEIAENVQARGGFVIAEDERNEPALLRPRTAGGLGLDGCWADDFHHVVRVLLTGERESYFANYTGTPAELTDTLAHGWLYRGQRRNTAGEMRGSACDELAPAQFIYCISNHDQTGNRAFGERLNQIITPAAYRAASALLCLVPYTPMLFMGQEWAASTPFQFFTDHNAELGRLVTKGRRQEFREFAAFADPATLEKIPDPQALETFTRSKLNWSERGQPEHAAVLNLYREFLQLRRTHPAFRERARGTWEVDQVGALVRLRFGPELLVLIDLVGGHAAEFEAAVIGSVLLSSNEPRFGGNASAGFREPTVLVCAG